jgi:hypothetical protein
LPTVRQFNATLEPSIDAPNLAAVVKPI